MVALINHNTNTLKFTQDSKSASRVYVLFRNRPVATILNGEIIWSNRGNTPQRYLPSSVVHKIQEVATMIIDDMFSCVVQSIAYVPRVGSEFVPDKMVNTDIKSIKIIGKFNNKWICEQVLVGGKRNTMKIDVAEFNMSYGHFNAVK